MEKLDELLKEEPKTEIKLDSNKSEIEKKKEILEELKIEAERLKREKEDREKELSSLKDLQMAVETGNFVTRIASEFNLYLNSNDDRGTSIIDGTRFPLLRALVLFPAIAIALNPIFASILSNGSLSIGASLLSSAAITKIDLNQKSKQYEELLKNHEEKLQAEINNIEEMGREIEKQFETLNDEIKSLQNVQEKLFREFEKDMLKSGDIKDMEVAELERSLKIRYAA